MILVKGLLINSFFHILIRISSKSVITDMMVRLILTSKYLVASGHTPMVLVYVNNRGGIASRPTSSLYTILGKLRPTSLMSLKLWVNRPCNGLSTSV